MVFDEVYKKHYHELKRFGRQLNMPVEKCEDLTQETFLRFYAELEKKVVFVNPRAWLYKVYLNLFRTSICNNKMVSDQYPSEIRDKTGTDLLEEFERNEKQKIVFELLESLEEREKELLILYNRGLSYNEIADVLEMNPRSVGKTLVRAIEILRNKIKTNYNELFEQN